MTARRPIHRMLLLVLGLVPLAAEAFKIDTHLWLAEHLLQELDAPQLSFGDVAVPIEAQVRDSIRAHPHAFLIGVLGADLYPDMVAGQMTTHPGLAPVLGDDPAIATLSAELGRPITGTVRGWQTDDWLKFVRDRADQVSGNRATPERAFAMGYMLHAAMDTWAHTYVNLYTGDLFSIVDNQEIAARHTAIENFIKEAHQKYVRPLGGASRSRSRPGQPQQRGPADNLSLHAAPTRFVRETLILHPAAANQYARTPGAQHVFAMWAVWDLAKRSEQGWQQVRGQLDQMLSEAEAEVLEAEQAWQLADSAKSQAVTALETALAHKRVAEAAASDAADALANTVGDVLAFLSDIPAVQATAATVENFLNYLPPAMRTGYHQAKTAAANADSSLRNAIDAHDAAVEASNEAAETALEALSVLDLKRQAEQAARHARQSLWNAVATGLGGWRQNIEAGTDAYIRAFEETAREIMRERGDRFRKGTNVTWPLTEWAACWGPLFGTPAMPLPPGMGAAACQEGLNAYGHARQNLTLLVNNAAFDLLALGALKQHVVAFEDDLHEAVTDGLPLAGQLIANAVGPGSESIPGSAGFVAQLWDHEVQAQDLDREFATDDSNRNLPVYAVRPGDAYSVSTMLRQDQLPGGHGNDMEAMLAFAPIRNALMLSRLTLLDGAGLNALTTGFGVTGSHYADGNPAYPDAAGPGAVLIGAIRSIDGNHQWQPVAPALPRRRTSGLDEALFDTEANIADRECRRFGYPANGNYGNDACRKDEDAAAHPHFGGWLSAKRGFRLWLDPELRENVFERLFVGPLSAAVCAKLDSRVPGYGGLSCSGEDPYPPSLASSASVSSFTTSVAGGRTIRVLQARPANPAGVRVQRRAPAPAAERSRARPTGVRPAKAERSPAVAPSRREEAAEQTRREAARAEAEPEKSQPARRDRREGPR